MAKVGDKTHTQHGVGTITEVDTVRGRTQYRVAGAGFNVWLDETKIHVANEGGMFAFRPMDEYAEEARNAPQYGLGLDPSIEHFAGLDATIEPGSTPVNENNSTALPYDWTPQYHHDVWADEQTIQPGEQEIDSDDRLKATDSVSGNRVDERPYPGPNPDLFAKSSRRRQAAHPSDWRSHYDAISGDPAALAAERDRLYDDMDNPDFYDRAGYIDDLLQSHGPEAFWNAADPSNDQGLSLEERGLSEPLHGEHHARRHQAGPFGVQFYPGSMDDYFDYVDDENARERELQRKRDEDDKAEGKWPRDSKGRPPGHQNYKMEERHAANEHGGYEWAEGYTPDERDIHDRSHLKHPESGTLEPGESWGHVGSTYRPAGLSDRYAYFDLEAAGNPDSPVERFRRDPVGFIELCGHLWTDGDDSLEKLADYTQLIDVDPTLREAAWSDVRQKAQRLRREGRVHVNDMGENRIYATVEGDHGTYDTMIAKGGSMGGFGGGQSITNWACSCDWGKWAFKRQMTYVGRLCSHGYATYLTMQSDYTKANPITKNQPYKKKWARTAGVVEDYKSWLDENDQNPEAASVAAFLSTIGDENPDDAEALYDYISDNHAEVPERDHDIEYVNTPDEAYKTADLLRTTPRSLTPDLRAVPEGEGEQWVDVTKDERETTGPDQIVKASYLDTMRFLHGAGEGITDFATGGGVGNSAGAAPSAPTPPSTGASSDPAPSGGSSGGGASGLWDATSVGGTNVDAKPSLPSLGTDIDGKAIPSSGDANRDQATKFVMDQMGANGAASFHTVPHTGSRRFAESSDAALLDKLRELSTTPAADDLGHMDDHNEELRDVVDELQDRGYDASFMVAAVEDSDPSDGKGDFAGKSVADWANEPFAGSGPAPKDWFSDSAGYVDENERDRFIDVTDAPDGDIIKFNDSRSAPQQGPKKSGSRHHADNFSPDSTANAPSPMPNMGLGTPDTPSEPFDVSQTLASLHLAGEPDAEDWENASGEPFLDEVKKDITGDGDDEGDGEGGGGGAGSALPGLVKGLGGGGGAAGAAGAAGGGAAASELAGLAVLAAKNCTGCGKPIDPLEEFPGGKCLSCHAGDPAVQHDIDNMSAEDLANMWGADVVHKHHRGSSDGVRRAGRGATSQVRVDPGTRQPNRPRQAMSPPDDFGYGGGEIHMAAPEEDSGDDIVAAFQRSAGAAAVMDNAPSGGSDDIADRALAFLRTAGRKYSPAEQRELEAEHHPLGARNLPNREDLIGTHYVLD